MEETICAISTPPGVGGIGIVRISGKDSIEIANKIFTNDKNKQLKNVKSHTINYGYIVEPTTKDKIDEVLVSVMRAPNTYTKEDIIEINCHGGTVAVKRVLEACLRAGARLSEPGEFTKRAFLNGRIDLTQAEAIIDIINSKTTISMENAFEQLEGNLSVKLKEYKQKILALLVHIEASLDYPEYDIEDVTNDYLINNINELINDLKIILEDSNKGKIIREGLVTTIVGKPNVGKSSLLNALLREKRAIVTEVPGTTRDVIEEYINIGGIPVKIVDTAGIRETEDVVEKIGVERTGEAIKKADLVIFVLDNSDKITQEELEIAKKISNKKVIIVINKIDLEGKLDENSIKEVLPDKQIIRVSVAKGEFIENIEKCIYDMFFKGHLDIKNDTLITNIRHKDLLEKSFYSLNSALEAIKEDMPLDCVSIDLKNSLEFLGSITGETVREDIINEIFKQFCLGK